MGISAAYYYPLRSLFERMSQSEQELTLKKMELLKMDPTKRVAFLKEIQQDNKEMHDTLEKWITQKKLYLKR